MEQPAKPIAATTFLLAFTAGFTDASTFIGANRLFSAHITGNFIVLAYDLVHGATRNEWAKLLAFPVFFVSIMVAGKIDSRSHSSHKLLFIEGTLLILAGLAALACRIWIYRPEWTTVFISTIVVIAMAFQNAFNRLYVSNIYGPTTVMTGNVTAAALDIVKVLGARPHDPEKLVMLQHNLMLIVVFLLGCLVGGFMVFRLGLTVIIVAGVLVLGYFCFGRKLS
jgi:uncharacterized membrane protein YoaK (UPF0700 family)